MCQLLYKYTLSLFTKKRRFLGLCRTIQLYDNGKIRRGKTDNVVLGGKALLKLPQAHSSFHPGSVLILLTED